MLKRTPLWTAHKNLGARLVEFGGWEMPVQYTSIMQEHRAVRTAAGLFDISHMGEFFFTGAGALDFLNAHLTNDLRKCDVGRGQYTLMCNEQGGVVDDLYIYRVEPLGYLLVVNASRIEADAAWLAGKLESWPSRRLVSFINGSDHRGAVAIQGPRVVEFIDNCFVDRALAGVPVERPSQLKKNEIAAFPFGDGSVFAGRTGYTGEDGFEIIGHNAQMEPIWQRLLEAGAAAGVKPCGLGARDTLRTEMGYPLFGHELDEATTPLEAGLGFFVALEKEFVGRTSLVEQKAKGVRKKCVAFKMTEMSAPPRPQYPVLNSEDGRRIGEVSSGTLSPSLGIGIGLAYVPPEFAKAGTPLQIEIRGKPASAIVVSKPVYQKPV